LDVIDILRGSTRVDDQFIESAQEAVTANRPAVAVVLIATAIEHILNMFYREVLETKSDLSTEDTTNVLRSTFHTKLGWLMLLATKHNLSEELRRRIMQVTELRNAFVHYKAPIASLDDLKQSGYDALVQQVEAIGLENMLRIPEQLETELETIMREMWPTYKTSQEITEAMFC
jgi:hypothetical protein